MRSYRIEYKEYQTSEVKAIVVHARNVREAYDKAYFDKLGGTPYSAWVESVLYPNNKVRHFKNFEGKPY